jgi:ABC-type uncharacterized transport system permease subunit
VHYGARTNNLAVASLVLSIASFVVMPFLAGIAGVILGHMARSQIRRTGEEGNGLAVAGLVIGYANIALCVLFGAILFVVVIAAIFASQAQPSPGP